MGSDVNSVVLVGRLTKDQELKYTGGGMALGKISLAVGRRVKKGDQWTDETSFFDVTLFGKSAESLNPYLLKGAQICVAGELRQDRWEQDGQKRSTVGVVANTIQLLGGKKEGSAPKQAAPQDFNDSPNTAGFDDDIIF